MSVTVTFDTAENCAVFAASANLTAEPDALAVNVPWGKLNLVKSASGVSGIASAAGEPTVTEFIMKGDPTDTNVAPLITVKADLGNGFYHIETVSGVDVFGLVEGLDPLHMDSFMFNSVSSITEVNPTTTGVDPDSGQGQWARIRIASTYRPLLPNFEYYDTLVTKSVPEIYLIDSGVNWDHEELVGIDHVDFWKAPAFEDFSDHVGHGTAMASAIAGGKVGIAKNIKLFNAKIVESGVGYCNFVDLGNLIDLIIAEAIANPNVTRIVSASWTMYQNVWVESKFQQLLDAGVTVVCAAGNTGIDVDLLTPAGMPQVITVGAVDKYDIPAGFNNIAPTDSGLTTNYGQRLDIFAPGDDVVVANAAGGYMLTSGTSCAAAFVAGAAGQLAALFANSVPNPILAEKIIDVSTKDAILFDDDRFSANENRLLHIIGAKDIQAAALDLYLGATTPDNTEIDVDLNVVIDTGPQLQLFPEEQFVWAVAYEDGETEAAYNDSISVNPVTGALKVTTPSVALPEGEHLKMVRFKVGATSATITLESPWMFFFQVDPTVDSLTTQNDITRALSDTTSTSIFLAQNVLK